MPDKICSHPDIDCQCMIDELSFGDVNAVIRMNYRLNSVSSAYLLPHIVHWSFNRDKSYYRCAIKVSHDPILFLIFRNKLIKSAPELGNIGFADEPF